MTDTKFGLGQLANPTPQWAKIAFRAFFYTTGITASVLDIFTEIPPDIKLSITSAVLKANLLVHAVCNMFGLDISQYEFKTAAPKDEELNK